jgi:hypothetical protein
VNRPQNRYSLPIFTEDEFLEGIMQRIVADDIAAWKGNRRGAEVAD